MSKTQKTLNGEDVTIDIKAIKKEVKPFVEKKFDNTNYELVKKEHIEGQSFIVFDYSTNKDEEGNVYYNFKCLDNKDKPFCFNGSSVLADQLEENGVPCFVKLLKRERSPPNKLRPFYWIFVPGEA